VRVEVSCLVYQILVRFIESFCSAEMLDKDDDFEHRFAGAIVTITGVAYFIAWSVSFYPQVVLNYQRKK
jgi:cystinosin